MILVMPPTKKSRTRSPPNITKGESHDCITITYLLSYHSPDTAPLSLYLVTLIFFLLDQDQIDNLLGTVEVNCCFE